MEIENTQPSLHLLPVEIIEEILSRLTVKLLLRFRCVSKSWRSLIESKRFIKHHLRNSTKNTCLAHQRVLVQNNNKEAKLSQCSLLSDKSDIHDLELNFLTNDDDDPIYSIYIAGCCNGLVCVLLNLNTYVDDCNTQFILWNPSIKISKKLPDIHNKSYCIKRYGFGWDESSGDYKVIAIVRVEEQTLCKIYSSKTDSWKAIDDCALSLSLKSHEPRGMLASGKLHWESYSPKWEIVAFDLNREAFEIVEQPSTNSSDGFCWPSLGMLGECLLVHCIRERCNDIWVMKEYGVKESWEKVMVISKFPCPPRTSPFVDAFCIGTKAEILLIRGRTFLISEMKKNCFRGQFPSYDMDFLDNWHCRLYDSDIYIESLVSPLEGRSNPH